MSYRHFGSKTSSSEHRSGEREAPEPMQRLHQLRSLRSDLLLFGSVTLSRQRFKSRGLRTPTTRSPHTANWPFLPLLGIHPGSDLGIVTQAIPEDIIAWWHPVVLKLRYQRVQKPWQPVPESKCCFTPGAVSLESGTATSLFSLESQMLRYFLFLYL